MSKSLTLRPAKELSPDFPEAIPQLPHTVAVRIREGLRNTSAYSDDGRLFLNRRLAKDLLATDQAGANRFYVELDDTDKLEDGAEQYAAAEAVTYEQTKRIQEPRDPIKREQLRDAERCVQALRDAPELEKIRVLEEAKIRRELPKLKSHIVASRGITTCELTGQPLQPDAHAHHADRKEDDPRRSLDPANIAICNPGPHREVHASGAESAIELEKFALDNNGSWRRPAD